MSDNFIASSREKLQELMERPLGELRLCAVLIDGTPFRDRQMIVALGINGPAEDWTRLSTLPIGWKNIVGTSLAASLHDPKSVLSRCSA